MLVWYTGVNSPHYHINSIFWDFEAHCELLWYSNQDSPNKKNFLQVLCDPGLITEDGTVAQVCSALPLSSKSSSTQQLYRDIVETQTHVYFDLSLQAIVFYSS